MARLTLVVGGVRSGKSDLAERIAAAHPPVTYLAAALPLTPDGGADPELAARIARHQQRRSAHDPPWRTVEEPWHLARAVADHGAAGCVLVESVTLWVANLLLGLPGQPALDDGAVRAAVAGLAEAGASAPARVVVVSDEVGWGGVPADALARRFADLLGEANQALAARADEVFACLAGLPLRLKPA
jgi:adenosylcobinamide kinase/adenosylcobinamide-phosphate guanylyltransferase